MQLRFESTICDYIEDVGIGIFDRVFSDFWYSFGKYGITIKIKYNKEVIIATDGWYDESTCLISAYFTRDVLTTNVSVMITQACCLFV